MERTEEIRATLINLFEDKIVCADCGRKLYFHRKRVDKHNYFSMWNKQIDVLHWHNDVVGLPAGAQLLARSEHTKVQAFRIGSALGMQFHLEVTPTLLEEWLDESSMVKDLKAVGGSKSQLREAFAEYNPRLQPLAEQVFGGFAARCNTYAQSLR